jgi:hypothetical protein
MSDMGHIPFETLPTLTVLLVLAAGNAPGLIAHCAQRVSRISQEI